MLVQAVARSVRFRSIVPWLALFGFIVLVLAESSEYNRGSEDRWIKGSGKRFELMPTNQIVIYDDQSYR